jgi:hypothetical protein
MGSYLTLPAFLLSRGNSAGCPGRLLFLGFGGVEGGGHEKILQFVVIMAECAFIAPRFLKNRVDAETLFSASYPSMPPSFAPVSPRAAAVEVLCLWATTHNSVDLLFRTAIEQVADVDRGLVKTLVYGVLRQKEYLDHILRRFSRHPLGKMKPRTLMTLRIGVYQLLF